MEKAEEESDEHEETETEEPWAQLDEEPAEEGFWRPSRKESTKRHLERRLLVRHTRLTKEERVTIGLEPRKAAAACALRTPRLGASAGFDSEGR